MKYYIAPNGKLYRDSVKFVQVCRQIDGVETVEMWDSCFIGGKDNDNLKNQLLLPIELFEDERQNVKFLEFVRLDFF